MKKIKDVIKCMWNAALAAVVGSAVMFSVLRVLKWILEPFSTTAIIIVCAVLFIASVLQQSLE